MTVNLARPDKRPGEARCRGPARWPSGCIGRATALRAPARHRSIEQTVRPVELGSSRQCGGRHFGVYSERLAKGCVGFCVSAHRVFEQCEESGNRSEPVRRVVDALVPERFEEAMQSDRPNGVGQLETGIGKQRDRHQPAEVVKELIGSVGELFEHTPTGRQVVRLQWIRASAAWSDGSPGFAAASCSTIARSSPSRP